ncbi:hypothetical protein ACGE0T_14005 [Parabacteroides sp. APC149_11_2_Y6]
MGLYRYRIFYEKDVIAKLAKRFSVTEQTVRAALRFATYSEQADLIRETALKEYGCLLYKKPMNLTTK